MSDPFLGQIMCASFGYAPTNYALCNGALLTIQQYQALYSLLGQTYGSTASTNFMLPDLRGRAIVGYGLNPTTQTQYPLAQRSGAEQITLTDAMVPGHQHQVNASSNVGTTGPVGNVYSTVGPGAAAGSKTYPLYAPPGAMVPLTNPVGAAGGGAAHPNMQPFLVLNFAIAMAGTYPPRP